MRWQTAWESGTVGFHLDRWDEESESWQRLNDAMLPSLITSNNGAVYYFNDETAQLIVSADDGYGPEHHKGHCGSVPPNSDLVIDAAIGNIQKRRSVEAECMLFSVCSYKVVRFLVESLLMAYKVGKGYNNPIVARF